MRVLHLTDRLSDRGGDEGRVAAPCPVRIVPGLEARDRTPVALDGLVAELAPDLVHIHTVLNPEVLEWAAGRPALITVQDHRYFCPARGKWTGSGHRCAEPMAPGTCAACFEDDCYLREVVGEWHPGPLAAWGDVRGRRELMERLVAVYDRAAAPTALALR